MSSQQDPFLPYWSNERSFSTSRISFTIAKMGEVSNPLRFVDVSVSHRVSRYECDCHTAADGYRLESTSVILFFKDLIMGNRSTIVTWTKSSSVHETLDAPSLW